MSVKVYNCDISSTTPKLVVTVASNWQNALICLYLKIAYWVLQMLFSLENGRIYPCFSLLFIVLSAARQSRSNEVITICHVVLTYALCKQENKHIVCSFSFLWTIKDILLSIICSTGLLLLIICHMLVISSVQALHCCCFLPLSFTEHLEKPNCVATSVKIFSKFICA